MSQASRAAIESHAGFIWVVADLLRGKFKAHEYGKVVLPFVVLRRLDCVLKATKTAVLAQAQRADDMEADDEARHRMLCRAAGAKAYNVSPLDFDKIWGMSADDLHDNLIYYINGFSPDLREILIDHFGFADILKKLSTAKVLVSVFDRFNQIDLGLGKVSNIEMGYIFEELLRRFSEMSNETAGEHFTPREVIGLIVDILIAGDLTLTTGGQIRTLYDPTCGTGGMLALGEEAIHAIDPRIKVELFGQELNPESFAICKSDMLMKGHDPENIVLGNTLTEDGHVALRPHYGLSNPPYGVDWKEDEVARFIRDEYERLGFDGRFGPGLPRVSDGQMLFLLHLVSKMRQDAQGSRVGIVMSGSPLFAGGAGSGESEIRRWLIENDLVEAIVGLPGELFYNTGIQTYVWFLANRKQRARRGKIQLINAADPRFWTTMRKSLGNKRREITDAGRAEIARLYRDMVDEGDAPGAVSKIVEARSFGYREIRIERPLRRRFDVIPEGVDRLRATPAFVKLTGDQQGALVDALAPEAPTGLDEPGLAQDVFFSRLAEAIRDIEDIRPKGSKARRITFTGALEKALIEAFGRVDPTAPPVVLERNGDNGVFAPDTDLRDTEIIGLDDDPRAYVEREVLPFVPDAWLDREHGDRDGKIGRVGYEINFNAMFFSPEERRSLDDLRGEISRLEIGIQKALQGMI